VLQALPEPVIVLDSQPFIIRYVNPAAEEFLNASHSALVGQTLASVFSEDSPIIFLLEKSAQEGRPMAEHDVTLGNKRLVSQPVSISAAPLGEGGFVLTIRVRAVADTLDRQWSHRGGARSVSAMAAMLAHELRNPLLSIRGAAQLLEVGLAESDRELTSLISEEVDRIRALVDRMEAFGDGVPADVAPVNIHAVLDQVKLAAVAGFARNVMFQETYDPSLPPVLGNRDQLVQIFTNLVKNAAESLPKTGGIIRLSTFYQRGFRLGGASGSPRVTLPIAVTIEDNGSGIPDSLQPHLFEPFVTSKANGTGLGLALVAKIITDHGAAISFESEPGRTVFRVSLPVALEAAQA
jgi:two-component system nitrogen regulation sensor histidine kinase GlnL